MNFVTKSQILNLVACVLNELIDLQDSSAKEFRDECQRKKKGKRKLSFIEHALHTVPYITSVIYSLQHPSEMLISIEPNRTEVTESFQVHNANMCWNEDTDNSLYWCSLKALILN